MTMYRVREGAGAGEWMMGAVTRNPEGLLLLAAGVALLMRSGRGHIAKYRSAGSMSEGGREHYGRGEQNQAGNGVSEQVTQVARRAGEYVSEATERVAETARSYASSAANYADETARVTMEGSRRVADQALETADYVVREQPWAVALTGLLAGAAVAAIFPPTRLEKRTLGEVGERFRSAASAAGQQVMEAGMQAGERLSEVAKERGLTSEGLKEAAQEIGETFSSALTGEEEGAGQRPSGQKTGEGVGSKSQHRPAQAAYKPQSAPHENTQSHKAGRPSGVPSSTGPSGGRR